MASVTCTFVNQVNVALSLKSSNVDHGEFTIAPPTTIQPNETVTWVNSSKGAGCEGGVVYAPAQAIPGVSLKKDSSLGLFGFQSPTVSEAINKMYPHGYIVCHWDNPVVGHNSYSSFSSVGKCSNNGGSGVNSKVSYTFSA